MPYKDPDQQREWKRQWARDHKPPAIRKPGRPKGSKNKVKTRISWEERAAYIAQYKASLGCSHCGESSPECLDLHHLDPDTKSDQWRKSGTPKYLPLLDFILETVICDILCSNCHRKEHARLRVPAA